MTLAVLTVSTPSSVVHATPQKEGDDAVVFALGGALRGYVHVIGTHHPSDWDQFTALRASLGSVDVMQTIAPADSLPRRRGSTTGYTGSLLHSWTAGAVADARSVQSTVESVAGRAPTPQMRETLALVLRACVDEVAHRPGLSRLLVAARRRETPSLLRFLTWSLRHGEAEAARYEHDVRTHRREARAAVRAWWGAARWFTVAPHPVLALLLSDYRGSLAHRADYLPAYAKIAEDMGREERARLDRVRSEVDSLRAAQRRGPRHRPASAAQPAVATTPVVSASLPVAHGRVRSA